ncbi:MAG: YqeG family HAD IIIA-type phosphatase [Bacillota bacterium]
MFHRLKPDYMVNSLWEIPLNGLKENNIKGIIIDLDNTLTNWNCSKIEDQVCQWLINLSQEGFKLCVVSNNSKKRINHSLSNLQIPFVPHAFKPGKRAFIKAMALLDTDNSTTAVIGDQLFTDILGGKRLGLFTILVTPLDKREFIGTKIMRKVEKVFLSRFL